MRGKDLGVGGSKVRTNVESAPCPLPVHAYGRLLISSSSPNQIYLKFHIPSKIDSSRRLQAWQVCSSNQNKIPRFSTKGLKPIQDLVSQLRIE